MNLLLPPNPTLERELTIRRYVTDGDCEYTWSTITSEYDGKIAEFFVFSDALKVSGVRVNVSAETQQVIADLLGCLPLTPKLSDLRWSQRAITLPPFTRGNPVGMSSTQAMIDHSSKIDAALASVPKAQGIIDTVGKLWVLDNSIAGKFINGVEVAMNYGWHFTPRLWSGYSEACASSIKHPDGTPVRLIQGRGTRHDKNHTDYSQVCVLVQKACTVDGVEMDLNDILTDPSLAPLASHQGTLRVLRQPGVPLP